MIVGNLGVDNLIVDNSIVGNVNGSLEKGGPSLNLALIQWYDFHSQTHPYKYGCPYLKLKKLYNFVAIDAIQDIVHIVPRFGKINEYFVNKYIF